MSDSAHKNKIIGSIYSENSYYTSSQAVRRVISSKNNYHSSNKRVLIAVVLLGFAGIIGIFFQFTRNIKKPFYQLAQENKFLRSPLNVNSNQNPTILQEYDTDKDGLSDNDEKNIYFTSPYIEDSDSDGKTDYEEVQSGSDPNCLLGSRCDGEEKQPFVDLSGSKNQNENVLGQITPQYLRTILKNSGINKDIYASLSDEELMQEYLKIIKEEGGKVESSSKNITDMTPKEIREFLKVNGMSQDVLDSFTDDEIKQILDDTIKGS